MNPKQLLRDPSVEPTDEVLAETLGGSYPVWQLLAEKLGALKIAVEWRFYNDGKAWLGKCVSGKKTVLWISIWDDPSLAGSYIQTSLFFTEKTRAGIQDLSIDENIKEKIAAEPAVGKLIPLIIRVDDEMALPDVFALIQYKQKLKR